MGSIKGDVTILGFADLLQHLASAQKAGTLTLVQGPNRKEIYLNPEGMRLLSTTSRKTSSLGEILIRTRKISRAQLDQLLLEHQKTGQRLGEIVSRRGIVTNADIEAALREQAQEEIYDLFAWLGAQFEFVEGPPPARLPDIPLAEVVVDASPTSVMLEAARRADELAVIMKVVRNESLIPIRTTKPFSQDPLGLNPDLMQAVYQQINARSGISEVIRLSLYPRFEALRAVYVLATKGYIRIMDREGATAAHLTSDSTRLRMVRPASGTFPSLPYRLPPGIRPSIMLLGDMVKYRGALAALVREAGYEVLEYNAVQAMDLLAQNKKVDCVILDVGLGHSDEYQFVSWLWENTRRPVVVLSSDASKEAAMAAVKKGARAYVVKPFTRDTILRTLAGIFQPAAPTPKASPTAR